MEEERPSGLTPTKRRHACIVSADLGTSAQLMVSEITCGGEWCESFDCPRTMVVFWHCFPLNRKSVARQQTTFVEWSTESCG